MVEPLQLFSLAIICQNLFYSMQKAFEYSALMKRSTLQQLFCFPLTHLVVLASRLCKESCMGGDIFHVFITFNKREKSQKSVPFSAYTAAITDFRCNCLI